jgi:putative hydrolase
MNIKLDVHTHTIASGHAFSTIQEMVASAKAKDLKILGLTDHGPTIRGACHPVYFKNFHVIPREIDGVKILMGAEINILNINGDLDLKDSTIDVLDIRIAGIHQSCYAPGSKKENTKGLIKVMENPKIDIISHPADGSAEIDLEEIVIAAKNNRILLEINNSSLNPNRGKLLAWENNKNLIKLCKKHQLKVILGSDAHIAYDIANYKHIFKLFEEENLPDELIINDKPELFWEYIKHD